MSYLSYLHEPQEAQVTPERLRQARIGRRLTQAEAAALCGVTQPTWHAWEHGHRHPTRRARAAIRQHFHVHLEPRRATVADRVLDWLNNRPDPATIQQIAEGVGVTPRTAARALDTLTTERAVFHWTARVPTARGVRPARLYVAARW